jgi:hypothetical protein
MKEKIIKILYDELIDIYCDTCRFAYKDENSWKKEGYNESPCCNCSRKNMNWEISRKEAEKIADKILKKLK